MLIEQGQGRGPCLILALNVPPLVLDAFATIRSEPVAVTTQPHSIQLPSATYSRSKDVDDTRNIHWFETVYDSMAFTETVSYVQRIYLFGIIADRFRLLDTVSTARDIFDIVMLPFLLVFSFRSIPKPRITVHFEVKKAQNDPISLVM